MRYLLLFVYLFSSLARAETFTDAHGRVVKLDGRPARVLSGSLASDEIALALAPAQLVAVSAAADDPRYSNVAPVPASVKGRFAGDVEAALALKPDLVILATYNRPETLRRFEQAKVPVYVLSDFATLDGVVTNVGTVGALLGDKSGGEKLQKQMTDELAALAARAPKGKKPRVLHAYPDGAVSGKETLFDAIARAAGAVNVAAEKGVVGWKKLDAETLLELDPDYVVTGDDGGKVAPALGRLKAVKEGRVIAIPGRELGAVSQHIVKAVAKLVEAFERKDAKSR